MKKYFLIIGLLLTMGLTTVVFNSCGDDKNEPGKEQTHNDNDNPSDPDNPIVEPTVSLSGVWTKISEVSICHIDTIKSEIDLGVNDDETWNIPNKQDGNIIVKYKKGNKYVSNYISFTYTNNVLEIFDRQYISYTIKELTATTFVLERSQTFQNAICITTIEFAKKTISEEPAIDLSDPSSITINDTYQVAFMFDGKQYHKVVDELYQVVYTSAAANALSNTGTNERFFTYWSYIRSKQDLFDFTIYKGELNSRMPSDGLFRSYLNVGSHPYDLEGYGDSGINGITIIWYDENGKYWTTNNLNNNITSINQSGSTFEITHVQDIPYSETYIANLCMKFRAVFSCNLYDEQGNSKKLTNGVYIGYFRNYQ